MLHCRFIFLLLFLFTTVFSLKSQDLLITNTNDTISCKVISYSDSLKYAYLQHGIILYKSVALSDIKRYMPNYYSAKSLQVVPETNKRYIIADKTKNDIGRLSVAMNAMYAFRGIRDQITYVNNNLLIKQLEQQIRHNWGASFVADLAINKLRTIYLGIAFSLLKGKGEINNATLLHPNSKVYTGDASLGISFNTIGINLLFKLLSSNDNNGLYFLLGFSRIFYAEQFNIPNYSFKHKWLYKWI